MRNSAYYAVHPNTHGSPAGPAAEAFCALVLRVALVDATVTAERSLELAYKLFAQAQLRQSWQSRTAAVVRELVRVQCSTTDEYPAPLPPHHRASGTGVPRTTALPEWGYPAPPRYRNGGTPHHRATGTAVPRITALPERRYPAPPRYRTSAFTFALTSIAERSCGDHRRWASMLVEG